MPMMDTARSADTVDQAAALAALRESLEDCRLCGLCGGRTQVVFGVGSPTAALMFVGEGPGFHEDRQGEPFVGQAGKLLTGLLGQIGLARSDVYIANVVKCRPPENRDPAEEEIAACSPHLMRQIGIIRPQVICTLGRFATRLLTGTELSMTAVHGKAKQVELGGVDTVVFPVFHPAAALYNPSNRVVLEEDFAKLRRLLDRGADVLRGGNAVEAYPVVRGTSETEPAPENPTTEPPANETATVPAPAHQQRRGQSADREEQLHLW
jgi:uracil-DNA glycosylase